MHDVQVARKYYKISLNVEILIDINFFGTKQAFGVNPRGIRCESERC